ncbi:Transferase [Arabidopsis suecica]|uniref:Transferase n=1 Tax=Arabidopsis suecica TaxID=45249 RepID=A0A8T1Y3R0_ARASU|nr:Transferase [Arabidopsis suecica]
MEEELVVISKSIVTPRNVKKPTSVKKIHLTPWDLSRLRFGYLQRGLLFPKPDPKTDIIISQLQASLSVALDRFYPLAGRLVKLANEDDTVSFFISCDGSGVEFVHAMAKNIELSDVLQLSGSVPRVFGSFFPATGIKNYHGVSRSLLMVQVTEIKDGVFIGFGYNSTVADATSIWKFINSWSEICSKDSGSETFQRCLHLKGWFFDRIDYPIHIPDPETKPTSYVTSTNLQEKMFHVTKENVLKLEAKTNYEADQKISSIQAVLAYIWLSMVKHSGMSQEEETHCRLPINMRQRLNPPLEEECFGNVSQTGIATVTVGELLDHGLGWAAMQINNMELSQTDEKAKEFAENWVKNIKIPVSVGSKDLVVTNSHRFDVYCNDFGWGKPIAARAGPPYLNGRLVVFKGIDQESLDFQACLLPQVVEKLLEDVEFNDYVCIV